MVRKSMMQSVTIDPAHRIDVDAEGVIDQRHAFDEPLLVVQRTVRDAHVHHVGQIDPREEPGSQQVPDPIAMPHQGPSSGGARNADNTS